MTPPHQAAGFTPQHKGRFGRWREWRADALLLLLVGLFFLSFFGWSLFGSKFIVGGDAFVESYPLRSLFWASVKQGQPLLWLPQLFSGYPLSSMAQTAIGYPLTWGYLFCAGYRAEQAYVLAPFLLSPVFTYAYARTIGRSRLAALFAGLSFGYGGLMLQAAGVVAMATNSFMWLPLVLIGLERSRGRGFIHGLLWASGAYAMAVLAGHGQSFLLVGIVVVLYGAFLTAALAWRATGAGATPSAGRAWHPLLVACAAVVCAVGVAAFQILETQRAARRSIRSSLSFATFSEGSFPPVVALKSLVAPLYYYRDVTPYLSLLALGLALYAVLSAVRRPRRDPRLFFWATVAVLAWVLMLGENTPLYRVVYHLPLINKFRLPSRHCFEWTFAISILAAYGWDALAALPGKWAGPDEQGRRDVWLGTLALVCAAAVGWLWWQATSVAPTDPTSSTGLPVTSYLLWKGVFTALSLFGLWRAWSVGVRLWRGLLLAAAVALVCFTEPYIVVSRCWAKFAKPAERFSAPAPATRFLMQYAPEQHRVYTRVNLFVEELATRPRLDPPNLTALYGLHNVAGYQSLVLDRYSRALGNVRNDAVNPRPYFPRDDTLFTGRSHVLDLLNTSFVVAFSELAQAPEEYEERGQIQFSAAGLGVELAPNTTRILMAGGAEADEVALVTSLAHAAHVRGGTPVGLLRIVGTDGRVVERQLQAGRDTAEWAHDRPDVRVSIPHAYAPIYDSQPGDAAGSFLSHRYWTRQQLGETLRVARVEISSLASEATLYVDKVTLFNSATGQSTPLAAAAGQMRVPVEPEHWERVYDQGQVLILHNRRALPRAWLVSEAEAVDGEEALRRIRGESATVFEPRRTALLEVRPERLPALAGGPPPPDDAVRLTYQTNGMTLETKAQTAALLIISEMNYPGWVAAVDGQKTEIFITDFLLRGVFVPAGAHRVELRYTAPAMRAGALISGLTLLLMTALALYARRRRHTARTLLAHTN